MCLSLYVFMNDCICLLCARVRQCIKEGGVCSCAGAMWANGVCMGEKVAWGGGRERRTSKSAEQHLTSTRRRVTVCRKTSSYACVRQDEIQFMIMFALVYLEVSAGQAGLDLKRAPNVNDADMYYRHNVISAARPDPCYIGFTIGNINTTEMTEYKAI